MSTMKTIVGLGAGVAAIAATAPASAQYYSRYGYSQPYNYGYSQPYNYGYSQSYGYRTDTSYATQQCTAAVQNRLYNRGSIGGILGAILGSNSNGQVLSVTQVSPRGDGSVRVRGLATSGRYASNGYGPYGVGAYGGLGYSYDRSADLSFRCDVGPNGAVYNLDIHRR